MLAGRKHFSSVFSQIMTYIILFIGLFFALFPFYWMVSSSIKVSWEIMQFPPTIIPQSFTFDHYIYVWNNVNLPRIFFNSIFVAVTSVALNLFFSCMVAYALVKLRFPGRKALFMLIIATMMIPFQLLMIPLFLLMDTYGMLNTYWALILPASTSPFSIFLLRQAFISVPDDFIDAALMDGAHHFKILYVITFPMIIPMAVTVALVNFFWSWNSFLWPVLVLFSDNMATLPVALARFSSFQSNIWGAIMAASTITAMPIVILYLFMQRKFIESLAMSGIKG